MAAQIPVEIRKITDPNGSSRIGVVTYLGEVMSTPDIRERLSSVEDKYRSLLEQCNQILAVIKTPKGRSDARLRWKLAEKIHTFLDSQMKEIGVVLVNYTEAIHRDLGVSESELRYIFRFHSRYKSLKEVDPQINWSKYRELMDFSNHEARKRCEALIKEGRITSDAEIREFKRKEKT
ncbi:MAG: hypothetical protein ABSD73_11505 [Candidatus Bathyarchaeia archaeon]|jgi:hypothetical protein